MSRFADTRPSRRTVRNTDVDRLARTRYLGTQLTPSPEDAPETRDGYADFSWLLATAEEFCLACGAGEHEHCDCEEEA